MLTIILLAKLVGFFVGALFLGISYVHYVEHLHTRRWKNYFLSLMFFCLAFICSVPMFINYS